ncbi:hypothetical protein [Rhizobium sp. NRK18]|uniref:hypothetical protein n=1 Tax=Rhizobium sp. NRK18 TaxID=2964667 RepID=UPI0021C31A56|nr:hypothetical protein [Rhizobium sp. NRK18]MCQ2005267.1 hypothetical protein [Rhizobium sp. NRK18]
MIEEIKNEISNLLRAHVDVSPYTLNEIAILCGFHGPEILEGILTGKLRVPLDKAMPLAKAIGCDERNLFVLVLKSWFGAELVNKVEEVFASDTASAVERDWIAFLREFYGDRIPELTPTLRRRLRLLVSLPD